MLASELWEDYFSSLCVIVKELIVDVRESKKLRLIGDNTCLEPSLTLRGGILVKMVSCGLIGMARVVGWDIPLMGLLYVLFLMLICTCVCFHPVLCVRIQWQ